MSNVRSLFVKRPLEGRRLAISDIHGCSRTFKKLLSKVKLTKKDQLFLLGDLVNKGPNSDKVLNRVLKLRNQGYQIFITLGNHEQIILNSNLKSEGQRKRTLNGMNSLNLLKGKMVRKEYLRLFKSSYHFIETDQHYLVHAGFNSSKNPFEEKKSMLNTRDFKYKSELFHEKQILIGHTPTELNEIKEGVKKEKRVICIDNGCVNRTEKNQGGLVCLNLDTKKIISKKYAEREQKKSFSILREAFL